MFQRGFDGFRGSDDLNGLRGVQGDNENFRGNNRVKEISGMLQGC